jgi:D-glycero-D-manno-heptose 1,7-bisphosphate phosphatase
MKQVPPKRVAQAVLLVGGKGTRLGALTASTPKPLMPIGDARVFLDLLLDNVARQGFTRITLLAGHFGEQIAARCDGKRIRDAEIEVLIEPAPLGTGGALRFAAAKLDPWFLLANGDTYFDMAYRALEAAVIAAGPSILGAVALRHVSDAGRYGRVETDAGLITAFREKSPDTLGQAGGINAGVYLLSRTVVDLIPEGTVSLEGTVFPELVKRRGLLGVERPGYFIDIGLPETLDQARLDLPTVMRRPALFLDRDGVINLDHGYVHRWEDFDWVMGARQTIKTANEAGWFVFVVTNQAGVARGLYDEAAIHQLHGQIRDDLATQGAHIDAFYYCPFHPDGIIASYRGHHPDRKPNPGMILRALSEWPVETATSLLIGDRDTDIAAAAAAGIRGFLFPGGDLESHFRQAAGKLGC